MLAVTLTNSVFLTILLGVLVLLQVVQRYLRNPLRKIPAAHPLAHFTSLWIHSIRWRHIENATLKKAHDRFGPIVCLGPNEISINCVQGGLREVYAGGFEKVNSRDGYNWYAFFANFGGRDNMFSTGSSKPHSTRKRMISNVYSKSFITANATLLAQMKFILYDRFLPYLSQTFDGDEPGELTIFPLLAATTMDIITGYLFGLKASSNLIDHPKQLRWWMDIYYSRHSHTFWPQEFPKLADFIQNWLRYPLTPQWVYDANDDIEQWVWKMCEIADASPKSGEPGGGEPQDLPVVYPQLKNTILKSDLPKVGTQSQAIIASELLDHVAAGFDTSSITLNYIIHELSKHADIQSCLQQELSTLSPCLTPASSPNLPNPKVLDTLPFLHAVVWETLRLHSAIPGPQPRFTPPQGCRLGPEERSYFVPGGVRVSASAGLLHLNEEVYEHAREWQPDRWLNMDLLDQERRKDMESRWFWAFGSGGRMCIGSHLAIYQIKYIIAALYSNYSTTIIDDTGIEQQDAYTAPPTSDMLKTKLAKLDV